MTVAEEEHEATTYQRRLGDRLRTIRQQQGLTLQQVEELSDGQWKAVVVGSYERGDRAVSVSKLAELGEFYNVPVSELLPKDDLPTGYGGLPSHGIKLNLRGLSDDDLDPELAPVARYAHTIQMQRGDFNGTVLTIRGEDVRALAVMLDAGPEELIERLHHAGLIVDD